VSAGYRVAPIFLIRMAGVPFETLARLATSKVSAAARLLLAKPQSQSRSGRTDNSELQRLLNDEVQAARVSLLRTAGEILPRYFVFSSGEVQNLLKDSAQTEGESLRARNNRAAGRERHLLLYLQRIAAKNDTFSEFGPSTWGVVQSTRNDIAFSADSPVSAREVFFERWTALSLAAALSADPTVRLELSPRLHPSGRIKDDAFISTDSGEIIPLDSATKAILACCDGQTPAHSLGCELTLLEQLANQNLVRWEVEIPRLEPHALNLLVSDVASWREGPMRKRWLNNLLPMAALCEEFAKAKDVDSRVEIMRQARRCLDDIGAVAQSSQRYLYNAANPIGEDCSRDCAFAIGEAMIDEVARDAEPWIDLWRDSYAYIASRVAAGLRGLFQSAPVIGGAVPLPAFLRHCETQKMSLTSHGLVALAHIAFLELKHAFQELLGKRADAAEWMLTGDECHFVRKHFEYPKFDEYTFPSADLQISARSVDQANRGEYEWVLAELHPPIAMLHHCMQWSCPDKPAFARALASTTCGQPNFFYGFVPADFTAHTTVRQFDVIPELSYFVAPDRGNPGWTIIQTAETEVFIDETSGDVGLRKSGSHEYLGSFSRYWIIPLGFHPFYFGRAPHMPRLRCGKVIVQRESWTVTAEEFGTGNFKGISSDLVVAVERLRAARGLPRFIYIRPTEQALRRSGAEGRDKDTKPVFIDLESYLFIEIFYRWLTKASEIEVTEMLPDPDHLLWQEADGRRTFELRTLIVPRE
jgi:lantibiotic biosynthesis dehydratase-like protein